MHNCHLMISYFLDESVKGNVMTAMDQIGLNTGSCVTFVPHQSSEHEDYLWFFPGNG